MTKSITLILVTLSLVACGGEPFTGEGETLAGAGGDGAEAGAVAVVSGGSDAQVGGSTSLAGKPAGGSAGSPAAGGRAGGSGSAGASGGSGPVTCEFDVTQLTAALPMTITWDDFIVTDGALCVTCRDKPCGSIKIISWGVPQLLDDGRYSYLPNAEMPMLSMNIGTNDGSCTKSTECGVKMSVASLQITVARQGSSWVIAKAEAGTGALGNQCTESAGFPNPFPASDDLRLEVDGSLSGLKIPCK